MSASKNISSLLSAKTYNERMALRCDFFIFGEQSEEPGQQDIEHDALLSGAR